MNILNECAIDYIIIMGYSICVANTLQTLFMAINIIGGRYIFRVKTNKTTKKTGLGFLHGLLFIFFWAFFWVEFLNSSPDSS